MTSEHDVSISNDQQECSLESPREEIDGDNETHVLKFENLQVIAKNKKSIIYDCHGVVQSGHVMAIMGPSGAGKTVFMSTLTLESIRGVQPTGTVTLNGDAMTEKIFRKHCYVVKEHDDHWPYLTCRETMMFTAELFGTAEKQSIPQVVDKMIKKMGLDVCRNTKCRSLSGGQRRRLSVSLALMKKTTTVLFFDEPTSGLDSASAFHCMQEIRSIAKSENLIVFCTIHQPSSKIFHGFNQLMLMSMGRQAYIGTVTEAREYFASIGYPMSTNVNPAEFYLDLLNSDFSSTEEVGSILNAWEERRDIDTIGSDEPLLDGGTNVNIFKTLPIMFRRHSKIIIRDPILYLGRAITFIFVSMFFALVYLEARPFEQAQALNKIWANIWIMGVPANMACVAVYALNFECKAVIAEAKNGMTSPSSYVLAKGILVLPILLIFSIFALSISCYGILGFIGSSYATVIIIWAANIFAFECAAEAFAILCDNPIMGMLCFMGFWFGAFLFGGIVLPFDDMTWPFLLLYYTMPLSYCMRSLIHAQYIDTTWDSCTDPTQSAVCTPSTNGADVLDAVGKIYPLYGSDNTVGGDIAAMIGIGLFWKTVHVVCLLLKARKVAHVKSLKKRL